MAKWFPPIDPGDLNNGSNRMDESKINGILTTLFSNNESYQGLFPVYGDLSPLNQNRAHSRDRKRSWHGGIDLMYPLNAPVYPVSEGFVVKAQDAGSDGDANNHVVLKHTIDGKNVYSLYTHLNKNTIPTAVKNLVGTTTSVNPSQYIGKIGDSGSANVHLHIEVFSKDKIERKGFFGDSEGSAFEQNPKRFRVTYSNNGTIGDKSWSGTVYPEENEVMVDQDYPDWKTIFQTDKKKYRKWMVKHKTVWSGINNVTDIPIDRVCWHYHPIQFIAAMQEQKKCFCLPIDIGTGLEVNNETITKYYNHNEKDFAGGYYPIGGNTLWHGGIHIKPQKDTEVYACLSGKIIAARLPSDDSLANKHYGSCNFILLEHSFRNKPLYCLYMHLKNLPLSKDDATIKKIGWLNNNEIQATLDNLTSGKTVKLDCSVSAGDLLWISGEYGSSGHRGKMIHWEFFSAVNFFGVPVEKEENAIPPLAGNSGWNTLQEKNKKLLVQKAGPVNGPLFSEETVTFYVAQCNYKDATADVYNKINWKVVATDGSYTKEFPAVGLKLEFKVPNELAGKTIKAHPYVNSMSNSLFVQTTVAFGKRPAWMLVEDTDGNFNVDNQQILKLFPKEMVGEDQLLTTDELVKFYKDNPGGNVEKLRDAVCKFVSEWGIPDLDAAVKVMKNKGWFSPKNNIAPYLWWKEAKGAGVKLPGSPLVWHYHPIKLLENLAIPQCDVVAQGNIFDLHWEKELGYCGDEIKLLAETDAADGTELDVCIGPQNKPVLKSKITATGGKLSFVWKIADVDCVGSDGKPVNEVLIDATIAPVGEQAVIETQLKIRAIVESAPENFSKDFAWNGYSVHAAFSQTIKGFKQTVNVSKNVMKAWGGYWIDMSRSGITGLVTGMPWNGFRWGRVTGIGMLPDQYHDGSQWRALPAGFIPQDGEYSAVGFIKSGSKFVQAGDTGQWPENFADYNFESVLYASKRNAWTTDTETRWSDKFALKRKGCTSKKENHCCTYTVALKLALNKIDSWQNHALVLCPGTLRSNAGCIFYGDNRIEMFAHEVGHLVGNPDEYAGGAVDPTVNGDGAVNGIDNNSLMGSSLTVVKKRHFVNFEKTAKTIAKNTYGRNYEYETVTI